MSTEPPEDDGIAREIRETFERCVCGRYVPADYADVHRSSCFVAGGITPLDETTEAEREWRREADTRPASTTVLVATEAARDVVAYHEPGGCYLTDGDDVEATTLDEAKRDDSAPCSLPACRRARDDVVYGDLYEPLENVDTET